ncbi:glycosyltransferase family 2 protein [Zoogloea sp.]|uniref:glycosyltransferase family 2 protein n=1 Tax=Zoogloea sp. TaxID=49181 RepID=UPI0026269F04|nr:glycosyltransferase family 2 protein [Zoogloea sp.]MDD3352554.1 glycosyltransferase family 2 protein [Zoogloea sp.]
MKKIDVIIVTYNGATWIRRNLMSLRQSSLLPHVIVVDNASTDDTVQIVRDEFPEVELITLQSNLGFGIGNNVGISKSIAQGAEYTYLFNQDAYVAPDAIEKLASFMDQHQDFGVVSPLHCCPDLDNIDRKTCNAYISPFASPFLCDAAMGKIENYYKIRGINAAAWFIRTSVFLKVGGFDPMFFMYGEDDDLINRFELHGVGFALLPSARIVHFNQSAPKKHEPNFWTDVKRKAERERSRLVVRVKDPTYSYPYMFRILIAEGLFLPLTNFIVRGQWKDFLITMLATFRVFTETGLIRKRARMCAKPAAHFLDLTHPKDDLGSVVAPALK